MSDATGCCPICDADRAKHADTCPADILRKLAEDVSKTTGLDVDVGGWEALLDNTDWGKGDLVALCGVPRGLSLAGQIAAMYGETGVLLLPMEMSPREAEDRFDAMSAMDVLDSLSPFLRKQPARVYRRERTVRDDFPEPIQDEINDPRQSYLRFNMPPNRFKGSKQHRGHRLRKRK